MYDLLVKLMFAAALAQLGISESNFVTPRSSKALISTEKRTRDVLRIEWKPISVFPEEARRFR